MKKIRIEKMLSVMIRFSGILTGIIATVTLVRFIKNSIIDERDVFAMVNCVIVFAGFLFLETVFKRFDNRSIYVSFADENERICMDMIQRIEKSLSSILNNYSLSSHRSINLGENISATKQVLIDDAQSFILFISNEYISNTACIEELYLIIETGKPIIPIILGNKSVIEGLPQVIREYICNIKACDLQPANGINDVVQEVVDAIQRQSQLMTPSKNRRSQRAKNSDNVYVTFSPDGKLIASSNKNGTIRIRDLQKNSTLETIQAGNKKTVKLQFSPDSNKIAINFDSGEIQVFDIKTGRLLSYYNK